MSEIKNLENSVIFTKGTLVGNENFIGNAYLSMLSVEDEFHCPIGNVTFEPGSRNHWHTHPGGQILLVSGGEGWYQEEGKKAQKIKEGDIIKISENIKHWHGATKDSYLVHLAISTNTQKGIVEWLEPVDEEYYQNL